MRRIHLNLDALKAARAELGALESERRAIDADLAEAQSALERARSAGASPNVTVPLERRVEDTRARRNEALCLPRAVVRTPRRPRRRTVAGTRSLADDRGARRPASDRAAPGTARNTVRARRCADQPPYPRLPRRPEHDRARPGADDGGIGEGSRLLGSALRSRRQRGGAPASRLDGSLRPRPRRDDRPRPDTAQRDPGRGVEADPTFPEPETIDSRAKATRAVLLPDRWCAIGYAAPRREVFRIWGNRIPDELLLSPDWLATDNPETLLGGDRAWMIDFDAALANGMALQITQQELNQQALRNHTVPFNLATATLERLIVVGIEWTKTAEESVADLTDLLAAHRDSTGLGFAELGTPTNNTESQASGCSPSEERTAVAAPAASGEKDALQLLSWALGSHRPRCRQTTSPARISPINGRRCT